MTSKGREKMKAPQGVTAPEEAIHFYEEALKKDRNFDLAYLGIAEANLVLYREKNGKLFLHRALDAARRAVQLNDTSPTAHYELANAYQAMSMKKETVEELKKVVSLSPNSDDGHRGLGKAYLALGQKDLAVQAYQKAITLNSYYWLNYNAAGQAYSQLGEYDKALAAFQRIIELEPDNSFGYLNAGVIYFQEGKYDQSIPFFQKALQIRPDYLTYSNLGTAFFFLKRYSEAVAMFEKAVAMDRGDIMLMSNMADSYRSLGKQDKARAAYQRAIYLGNEELKTNPKDASTMDLIAIDYAKMGDALQAHSLIKRARAIDKKNVNYIYDEAVIYALSGKTSEALTALQESFEKQYSVQEAINDPELDSLRNSPEFKRLIDKYSKQAAVPPVAAQSPK